MKFANCTANGQLWLYNMGLPGYGSLGVQGVYFVKTVTWKIFFIFCLLALNLKMNGLLFGIFSREKFQIQIFFIFCLLALNLKMNGLLFGIFSRKKFQILITFNRIHSFILLRI